MQNTEPNATENLLQSASDEAVVPTTQPPASPDNPPWGSWAAISLWVASIFFIVIFPNIFVLPYIAQQKIDLTDQAKLLEFAKTDPTAVLLQLAAIFPAHILTIVLSWLIVTRLNKFSFKQTLGWKWGGFKIWHLLLISFFCYAVGLTLIGIFGERENDFQKMLQSSRNAVYLVAFFATFTAPIVEEVVYRGVLYSAFQRRIGVIYSVLLVTILFAAIHIPQYSQNSNPDYVTIFTLCFVSLVITLVRVKSKNLLPCIILHMIFNGIQALLMVFEPLLRKQINQNPDPASVLFHLFC